MQLNCRILMPSLKQFIIHVDKFELACKQSGHRPDCSTGVVWSGSIRLATESYNIAAVVNADDISRNWRRKVKMIHVNNEFTDLF